MEEAKSGKVGSLNLPIGFRFHPTDEELLVHYLTRKIFSMPLPALIIPEVLDVFDSFPYDLPAGDLREKRYFFSKTNGDINSKGCSRLIAGRDCSGYWKAVGQDQLIVVPISGTGTGISSQQQQLVIGTLKTLRFYQAKHSGFLRTRWFMHQYSLVNLSPSDQNVNMTQVGDWSIFRIYQNKLLISKNGRAKANVVAEQCNKTSTRKRPIDVVLQDKEEFQLGIPPPSSTSSTKSAVTDISSNQSLELDQEVTSCHFRF
ncbi:NAC domain-containing protein 83-like isoform X1 [Lycium ferocissimum]|uniref:NAC domain-containing protein 83-like isoform X1 n=1 Tax=Lycium ferocissimum TaxID=112874 RepID=UPI002814DEB7|nr:NAC domain-containing protein 83-like isoform X1 [Lycium ferocissimum]